MSLKTLAEKAAADRDRLVEHKGGGKRVHRAFYPGSSISALCDCPEGRNHPVHLPEPPSPQQRSAWTGMFREYSAEQSEFPRAGGWDTPEHLPWVEVSRTPCPDTDGAPLRPANYLCRHKHTHWGAHYAQNWHPSLRTGSVAAIPCPTDHREGRR